MGSPGSLGTRGFVVENEWYWRISENAQTFDAEAAARDFLAPLARSAKDTLAISAITHADHEVTFVLGTEPVVLRLARGAHDRIAVNAFIGELNRVLAPRDHAFALVAPRRYELRGVLLTRDELAALLGTPVLIVPSGRPSAQVITVPPT